MVDHDMGLVLDVCDRIVVLDLGQVVAVGTPSEIERQRRGQARLPGHDARGSGVGVMTREENRVRRPAA